MTITFRNGLSAKTVDTYMSALKQVNGGSFPSNLDFLKDIPSVLAILQTKSQNTQRVYLIAIVSSLYDTNDELKKFYTDMMDVLNVKAKEQYATKKLTASQTEKWVDDDKLVDIRHKLESLPFVDKVIYCLFTMMPPRRSQDYALMMIGEPKDSTKNYYYNSAFYFNMYKTRKTYGTQYVPITKELNQVIQEYLTHHHNGSNHFLVNPNGSMIDTSKKMYYKLVKIFGAGSSILRNSMVSENAELTDAINLVKDTARNMGTSREVLTDIYSKST